MNLSFKELTKQVEAGKYGNVVNIGKVSYYLLDKTDYSFHLYVIEDEGIRNELKYDLRNKEYYIIREGRNVLFNQANLDRLVPRYRKTQYYNWREKDLFDSNEGKIEFFSLVSFEGNEQMYSEMVDTIGALGNELVDMTSRALVRLITDFNKLELLYKAGIPVHIVENESIRDRIVEAGKSDKGKLHQILGISRAQLTYFRNNLSTETNTYRRYTNRTADVLNSLRAIPVKEYNEYMSDITLVEELESKYNLENRKVEFTALRVLNDLADAIKEDEKRNNGKTYRFDRGFYSFVKEHNHPNKRRLIEYLLFECLVSQGMEFWEALSQYEDYFRMSKELGNERFEVYPKYLKTYHDIVSRNFRSIQDEATNNKFSKATARYEHREDTVKGYTVITPKKPKDLVSEGNSLNHCIPSYVSRVAEGGTQIVLMRDSKDIEESLITVEIRNDKIVQARGFSNRLPEQEEIDALNRYAKKQGLGIVSFT